MIGANGGIGAALVHALTELGRPVVGLGRGSTPPVNLVDEDSIANAAATLGAGLRLVIDATGFLHSEAFVPEKSLRELDPAHLAYAFAINATGPAMIMKHFLPLLARNERAVFATLSARIGSISDNQLGGWYSYRASKAALNQLVRTAAIELGRTHKQAMCVALHPGTVHTRLSAPFAKVGLEVQTPAQSAQRLLSVLDALTIQQSGLLFDHRGKQIPF